MILDELLLTLRAVKQMSTARVRLRRFHRGYCVICEDSTVFFEESDWLRDGYRCARCQSIPRWRALIAVLETEFKHWRRSSIHESSPQGSAAEKLARECAHYTPTHFYPDAPLGSLRSGYRCENLERQTFGDEQFDLVITQDVMEHVLNPRDAFREIARTLKPGGAHVFTVPWFYWRDTIVRAIDDGSGKAQHNASPDYHGSPISDAGSLVVTEWGANLLPVIQESSGLTTTIRRLYDRRLGIDGEFREVFVSFKR